MPSFGAALVRSTPRRAARALGIGFLCLGFGHWSFRVLGIRVLGLWALEFWLLDLGQRVLFAVGIRTRLLGGSWDLVSTVISTLSGVTSSCKYS